MLKRPSSRRKSSSEELVLNLVPMMDALVTMIAFLMFSMSFLNLVQIESPVPVVKSSDVFEVMKERPLQLSLTIRENSAELWSPFDRIKTQTFPNRPDGQPDLVLLHGALIETKRSFPNETKIILAPESTISYDRLISIIDSVRALEPGDPALYQKDPKTGVDQQVKILFPEIVFGNLLGDT